MSSVSRTGVDVGFLRRQRKATIDDFEREAEKEIRKMILILFTWLVKMTPVDTGQARAGWTMEMRQPSEWAPENGLTRYPAPPMPDTTRFRLGLIAWIANNVNHIVYLDEGASDQAPAGMTAVALSNLDALYGG